MSGFTALTELEGDERAVDVLTAFRTLLRDICARRGVRIAKWLGDGVMLVCVTTRPLLETILELHYVVGEVSGPVETVSIRSGITSGEVILMEGDDYVGHCVNVAARLCDQAQPGEALAAPAVMGHLPSWGVTVAEAHVTLRGGREARARLEHPDGPGRRGRFPGPHLRAPPDRRHRRGDRPRRPGLGRAVLLPGMRRHLAPAAGEDDVRTDTAVGFPGHPAAVRPARGGAGPARAPDATS